MAAVSCSTALDLRAIAAAAGSLNPDAVRYEDGQLVVLDVEQSALEQALTGSDPLPSARFAKLALINQAYEAEFAAIKQQYPDAERESWPIQLSEAAALAGDPLAPTPFLDALLVARGFGESKAELAAKVQAKNQAYSIVSASLTGKRHKLERQVMDADTPEQVYGIIW